MLAPCLPPKAPGVLRSVQLVTKRVKVRGSPVAPNGQDAVFLIMFPILYLSLDLFTKFYT